MKNNIKYLTLIVTVSLTLLVGCSEFFDKIEDFNVGVTNTVFEQSAVIELKDYFGDQENLISTDLKVAFSGTDADKLVNEAGDFTISETDGFIQLNVNPNKSTGVKELNFDVTISGGDYRTETFPVTLKDTVSHVRLSLVDENKIKGNTDEVTLDAGLTDNTVTTAIVVKTSIEKSTNTTEIIIKDGTQFKDASGSIITGSNLKINVSNTDQYSDVLPIFESTVFKDATISNKVPDLIFGNTKISMDVDGTAVKEFTNAIDVTTNIVSGLINPFTGVEVKLDDTFPIYTNDEGTTDWTYHGVGTVVESTIANTFSIAFKTTHLSNYAVVNFVDTYATCYTLGYNITSTNLSTDFTAEFVIQLEYTARFSNNIVFNSSNINLFYISIKNGKVTKVDRSPTLSLYRTYMINKILESGKDIYTYGSDRINGFDITYNTQLLIKSNGVTYRTNLSDIATIINCEFTANLSQDLTQLVDIANLKNINIDVAANCNGSVFVPNGFPFYVLRENGQYSYEGTIRNGKMTLNGFELGKEYTFKTVYKGESHFQEWTFDSENFVDHNFKVPTDTCSKLGL